MIDALGHGVVRVDEAKQGALRVLVRLADADVGSERERRDDFGEADFDGSRSRGHASVLPGPGTAVIID